MNQDWPDRWIDAGLQELHGSRPPDLSARVLLALQETPAAALPTVRAAWPDRWRWAMAAAALVLLGVGVGALLAPGAERAAGDTLVQVELRVHDGALECVQIDAAGVHRSRHAAGTAAVFATRAGNRLLAAAPCRFQVGSFGELATGPATELEVRSMSVRWQHGVVAASSLTLAVVAGVVTWHSLQQGGTANAGEVLQLEAGGPGAAEPSSGGDDLERLRQRVRQLEQQNAELQLQLAREPAPAAAAEAPPPPVEPAVAGAVFRDDRYAEALAALDWQLMGEVTNTMGPLLVELAAAMERDGELPLDVAAKIGELNAKLVAQIPALLKSGLPGTGPNGAYTHPLVAANVLAKTLDAAGVALDAGQRERIAGLVRSFAAETQAVADSQQDLDLQRLAAEAETKDRFYREVSSLLTPEQQQTMYPAGADRYDGTSLFHSSLFTGQFVEPVQAKGPAEFARSVSRSYGDALGLDDAASGQVRAIVERMTGASPELWQQPAGKVERDLRMLKAGRAGTAMRHQLEIMREILRQVPMTAEQRQKFSSMKRLFVPLPQ
jgi:hypothetical protein